MKKKQLLGILLAGTMMVGAAVPVFAADGDRVKITYAQWGNETETAATQAVADKFNSEQDKIEVEVVKIDHDTYVTKLNAMATAGELPIRLRPIENYMGMKVRCPLLCVHVSLVLVFVKLLYRG